MHVGDGAENPVCPGCLLQIMAICGFAFQHGGGKVAVRPGFTTVPTSTS
jgi:hypothetical protein